MNAKTLVFSNSILKDRIEVLRDTKDQLRFRTYLEPHGGQTELHYHSKLHETFTVLEGALHVRIDTNTIVLKAGDTYTIAPFTQHKFYNDTNTQTVFDVTIIQPKHMLKALQIMYGLTEDGKTTRTGLPRHPLHAAVALHMMDAFSPRLPFILQNISISLLALLGKALGIKAKLLKRYCG